MIAIQLDATHHKHCLSLRRVSHVVCQCAQLWQSIVLFDRMVQSQITWRIYETPKSWLTVFLYLLFHLFLFLKILRCWFHQQSFLPMPFPLFTNATSLCPLIHSLCFSLPPTSLYLGMFYMSWFHVNSRHIWCLIIIDHYKPIELTMLFHLGLFTIQYRYANCRWAECRGAIFKVFKLSTLFCLRQGRGPGTTWANPINYFTPVTCGLFL